MNNKKRWNKTKYKIITKNHIKNHTVKYKKNKINNLRKKTMKNILTRRFKKVI